MTLGFIRPPIFPPLLPPGLPNAPPDIQNPLRKNPPTGGFGSSSPNTKTPPGTGPQPPAIGPFGRMGTGGAYIYYRWTGKKLISYGCTEAVQVTKLTRGYTHTIPRGSTLHVGGLIFTSGETLYCPQVRNFVLSFLTVLFPGETTKRPVGDSHLEGGYSMEVGSYTIHLQPIGSPTNDTVPITIDPTITFPGGWKGPDPKREKEKDAPAVKPPRPTIKPLTPDRTPQTPDPKPDIDPAPNPEPPPKKPPAPATPKPGDPKPTVTPRKPPTPKPSPPPAPVPKPSPQPSESETADAPTPLKQLDKLTATAKELKPKTITQTARDQHLTKDGPVTGNGPQPNLEDIARELGRQEQKLAKIIDRVTPQNAGPLDIGDLLQILELIRDLLTNNVSGAIYEVEAACTITGEQEPRRHTIEVPGGLDRNTAAIARLDAIAELIGAAQLLKQATCGRNTSTPGNNVTVTAYEVMQG